MYALDVAVPHQLMASVIGRCAKVRDVRRLLRHDDRAATAPL